MLKIFFRKEFLLLGFFLIVSLGLMGGVCGEEGDTIFIGQPSDSEEDAIPGLTDLDLGTKSVTVNQGGTKALSITKTYSDETIEICIEGALEACADIIFSYDDTIIEISSDAVITGISVGNTEVTVSAESDPEVSDFFDVKVQEKEPTLEIIADKMTIFEGEELNLKTDVTTEGISSNMYLEWSAHQLSDTNPPKDVTSLVLSSDLGDEVVFTGPDVEKTTDFLIGVSHLQGADAGTENILLDSAEKTIKVEPLAPLPEVVVSSMTVDPPIVTINQGSTKAPTITKTYSDETTEICTEGAGSKCDDLSFSYDEELIEISSDAVITGILLGNTEVTVSLKDNPSISVIFDVTTVFLEITADKMTIFEGEEVQLSAELTGLNLEELSEGSLGWKVQDLGTNFSDPPDLSGSLLSNVTGNETTFTGPDIDETESYLVTVSFFKGLNFSSEITATKTITVNPIQSTPTPSPTSTPTPTPTPPAQLEVYVATTGNDSNPGTAAQPMLTLQAAIDRAVALGVTDVKMAGGTYNVSTTINISNNVSIFGGYLADFLTRDVTGNPTIIQDTGTGGGSAENPKPTMNFAVGVDGTVDGCEIIGGIGKTVALNLSGNNNTVITGSNLKGGSSGIITIAIKSSNSNSPTITNSTINGGGGTTSNGIFNDNSSPTITFSTINGGSGQSSFAIVNQSSSPTIENNTINGGSGSIKSTGISNTSSSGPLIQNNTIDGGTGSSSYGIVTTQNDLE